MPLSRGMLGFSARYFLILSAGMSVPITSSCSPHSAMRLTLASRLSDVQQQDARRLRPDLQLTLDLALRLLDRLFRRHLLVGHASPLNEMTDTSHRSTGRRVCPPSSCH